MAPKFFHVVSRRRLLGIALFGAASMLATKWARAAELPAQRPAELRVSYSQSLGRARPGGSGGRVIVISARESFLESGRKRQDFAMSAAELDVFYAKLRKTGIDRAVTLKRERPILDFPPKSLSIEWGNGKVELGLTYREAVSNLRAWNEVMELIDGLLKRKGL
jgi:hypothetical protein